VEERWEGVGIAEEGAVCLVSVFLLEPRQVEPSGHASDLVVVTRGRLQLMGLKQRDIKSRTRADLALIWPRCPASGPQCES
jgi:hypothetical protein